MYTSASVPSRRIILTLFALLTGVALPVAAATVVLDQADYVFTGANEPGAPDWTKTQTGTPATSPVAGVGWAIADPDNASSLIYEHATSALSGDPADPRFRNTARISATVQTPPVPDTSPAWSDDAVGWRLILDDGLHRAELALARDAGTKARLVRLQDAPTALPIPFGWDNDFPNTYTIERFPPGEFTAVFTVTVTSGDPAATPRSVSMTFFGAQLAGTQLTTGGRFAWGAGLEGGGTFFWQEVHARVESEQVPAPTPGKVSLGGFIDSAGNIRDGSVLLLQKGPDPGGKATFGGNVQFQSGDPSPTGSVRYFDHVTRDDIKATSFETLVIGTGPCGPDTHALIIGKATVNGVPDQDFQINVDDCGEPGSQLPGTSASGPDMLMIMTGPSEVYMNGGPLVGGNIQVKKAQ